MQSPRWRGDHPITQAWGCTDVDVEPFDPRFPSCAHFHQGVDVGWADAANQNFEIFAREDCEVSICYITPGESALVLRVGGDQGEDLWHFHCSEHFVVAGDPVKAGQLVARAGSIGLAEGIHLHFEVRPAGSPYQPYNSMDPMPWLAPMPAPPQHDEVDDDMPAEVPGPHFPKLGPFDSSSPVTLFNGVNSGQDRVYVRFRNDNPDRNGGAASGIALLVADDGTPIDSFSLSLSPSRATEWQLPLDKVGNLILQSVSAPVSASVKFGKR